MTTVRTLIAIGSVIILSAAGCGEPGVVETVRVPEDAGGTATGDGGSAGDAGGLPDPPCPSGWTCTNLGMIGTAADQNGKPVTYSCGQGKLMDCDDADPAATCAPLTVPICAHITVSGMNLVSCGQRCLP
ncbi:MAG TPA: hypothetical protein VK540_04550 [Polyangiaceae bacterium]|jgi:hypothetical protein|nr:hypothetical protein [Polyangiaceae bacterium]